MRFMNEEVKRIRHDRLCYLLEPFGFKFTKPFVFDCGDTVRVTGPGVPWLTSGTSECGDEWTSSGACLQKLIDLQLVPEVVLEILAGESE